jgi:hypothetical protein
VSLRIFKSIFTPRKDPEKSSHPRIEPTYRRGFVAFVSNVDAVYRFSPGDMLESAQASMRLRVGIPAHELARRLPVFILPLTYIQDDPDFTYLGSPHAIVVGKAPARFSPSARILPQHWWSGSKKWRANTACSWISAMM